MILHIKKHFVSSTKKVMEYIFIKKNAVATNDDNDDDDDDDDDDDEDEDDLSKKN